MATFLHRYRLSTGESVVVACVTDQQTDADTILTALLAQQPAPTRFEYRGLLKVLGENVFFWRNSGHRS